MHVSRNLGWGTLSDELELLSFSFRWKILFLVFVGMALRKGCGKVKAVPDVLECC